jgi:hypothetical protein
LHIVLDVQQTADGRLAGDVRVAGSRATRPFEGIIELVGVIEAFLANPPSAPGIAGADTVTQSSNAG